MLWIVSSWSSSSTSLILFLALVIFRHQQQPNPKKHNMTATDATEEPPRKRPKTTEDWKDHTLNIEEAVMKADEGRTLTEIADSKVSVLQGVGPKADEIMESMGLETVRELATYKFYLAAKAIQTLSKVEGAFRPSGSPMNIDKMLDKEYESKKFSEVLASPVSILQGLTEKADVTLTGLGVKTVGDLADCKYFQWAEAICELSKYEELMSKEERRAQKLLKRLA